MRNFAPADPPRPDQQQHKTSLADGHVTSFDEKDIPLLAIAVWTANRQMDRQTNDSR
jgi:hypothetical protein